MITTAAIATMKNMVNPRTVAIDLPSTPKTLVFPSWSNIPAAPFRRRGETGWFAVGILLIGMDGMPPGVVFCGAEAFAFIINVAVFD